MTSEAVACLEVLDPGLLATVQDTGRPGLAALGVGRGGAADPLGLLVANALLGNPGDAAVLELTLPGASLRAVRDVVVGLAGADLGARVTGSATPVPPGRTVALRAGEVLAFEGTDAPVARGCRSYLALPGGVDVPAVLGSRSTALAAGFGGFHGRALRPGDALAAGATSLDRPAAAWPGPVSDPRAGPFRVLPGPQGPGPRPAAPMRAWAGRRDLDRPPGQRPDRAPPGRPGPGRRRPLTSHRMASLPVPSSCRRTAGRSCSSPTTSPQAATRSSPSWSARTAPGSGSWRRVTRSGSTSSTRQPRAGSPTPSRRPLAVAGDQLREAATWDALWRGAGG